MSAPQNALKSYEIYTRKIKPVWTLTDGLPSGKILTDHDTLNWQVRSIANYFTQVLERPWQLSTYAAGSGTSETQTEKSQTCSKQFWLPLFLKQITQRPIIASIIPQWCKFRIFETFSIEIIVEFFGFYLKFLPGNYPKIQILLRYLIFLKCLRN